MYAFIDGIVAEKTTDSIVLEAGGIGYSVLVSGACLSACPAAGQRMKVYTVLNVRQDAVELFGFYSKEEKHMFQRLSGVSGIGPRTALAILSAMSVRDLSIALVAGDSGALTKVPGIGKKTAQRLVLELKDKVEETELTGTSVSPRVAQQGPEAEAIAALVSLGYAPSEAAQAISRVAGQTEKADEMIFLALKSLG